MVDNINNNMYVADAIFLNKKQFGFKDKQTGEFKEGVTTNVLVFDALTVNGYERPRVVSLTVPPTEDDGEMYSVNTPMKVEFSLYFDKRTGNMIPKPTAIRLA